MRRRRLQPKAAPAPSRGRGAAVAAVGAPRITWIDSLVPLRVQVPIRPVVVKPSFARVVPLNVALLTIGVFETYVESITNPLTAAKKEAVIPETLDAGTITTVPLKDAGPKIPYCGKMLLGPLQTTAKSDLIAPLALHPLMPFGVAPVRFKLPLV